MSECGVLRRLEAKLYSWLACGVFGKKRGTISGETAPLRLDRLVVI